MRSSLLWLSLLAAPPELLDRILAVVDGRPVMLSEVRLLERLQGLETKAALEELIDERLMFREATRLAQTGLRPEEEERAYQSLRARKEAAELPEAALRQLARRQTTILKYVELRFRPQVRVTDEALRQAYDTAYGGRKDAPSFEEAAAELRRRLADAELGERIEAWVRELRSAADIRYNALESPGPALPSPSDTGPPRR
jgi:hypothetical protein